MITELLAATSTKVGLFKNACVTAEAAWAFAAVVVVVMVRVLAAKRRLPTTPQSEDWMMISLSATFKTAASSVRKLFANVAISAQLVAGSTSTITSVTNVVTVKLG